MPTGSNASSGGSGGAPSGSAGGSLTGTYPNPTIATIPSGATATTQTAADGSTKVATTAYVDTAGALKANLAGPTFTGVVTLPTGTVATTQSAADNSTKLGTTAYIDTADALKANLAGPTFTGSPVLPTGTTGVTQTAGTNTTTLATTAYADAIGDARDASPFPTSPAVFAETFARNEHGAASGASAGTTGVCVAQLIYLRKGMVISNLSVMVGATIAGTATHFWQALTDTSRVMVAVTADDTSSGSGMTLNTIRTQAVATIASGASSTYTVPTSGWYYHFVNSTAGTVFTPVQITPNAALMGIAPIVAGTSETLSTGPPAFTKTFGAISAVAKIMYCAVS